jgi:hypothetical protein
LHRTSVNSFREKEKEAENLKETHQEYFEPLVLAKHRGNLDFSITLKSQFHLRPTRPTILTNQQQKLIKETVETWLRDGIMTPVASEIASPVVIGKKKVGTDRICVDYCELMFLTVKDIYALPIIKTMLQNKKTFEWMSNINLRSAYHQILVTPETD